MSTLSAVRSQALVGKIQRPQEPFTEDLLRMVGGRLIGFLDRANLKHPQRAVGLYVLAVWSRLLAWQMRRATQLLLNSLDDRTLADIGLQRSEIDRVLREVGWRKELWRI
jgi:uncharacterized protein YjiS (DUF1127 family)